MHLKLVILALAFLTTTAYPLHRDRFIREATWDYHHQSANEKTEVTKKFNGAWKSHMDSSNLYAQDPQNPMAGEVRHKLNQESERLRTRLRQELAELRERLSPLSPSLSRPQHALANVRDLLAPLTQELQGALNFNTRQLCGDLGLHLEQSAGTPESAALDRELVRRIGQTLDDSWRRATSYIEEFGTKTADVLRELTDAGERKVWREVTDRLGLEVGAAGSEVQGRGAALKAFLAELLASAQPLRDEMASRVAQFCQSSTTQNEQFVANLEQQLVWLEQSPSLQQSRAESLQEDFSTRLSALLQDIVHTMN